ncbi:S8 family serine peptidase [Gorillibacterium sp. sgz500922]|uniref:S8 family serine peptidase n=1 Tax=Gorillibacterium sp. sgz500922 TaxID=3446694 RepID=UPI003F67540F
MKKGFRTLSTLAIAAALVINGAFGTAGAAPSAQSSVQGALPASSGAILSANLDTASPGNISVIVQLKGTSAGGGEDANAGQQAVLDAAEAAGIPLAVEVRYHNALNGFAATLPANRIPNLAALPGVASIYPNTALLPLADTEITVTDTVSPYADTEIAASPDPAALYADTAPLKQTNADLAQAAGYTGKGLKVGMVDTGVDIHHPDIAAAYRGGYDSVNRDNDPTDNPGAHGTHVAGILVGRGDSQADGALHHRGVAPDAELYVYKSFFLQDPSNPDSYVATSALILDGIEHAIRDKVDVLNLSLGGSVEQDLNSPEVVAINNAVRQGITVITASGNSGLPGSLGSLAVAQLGIAVGASTLPANQYTGSLTPVLSANPAAAVDPDTATDPEPESSAAESVTSVTYSTYQYQIMAQGSKPLDFQKLLDGTPREIVYVGLGREADYAQADVAGKVVLISRGDLPFETKIKTAKAHHALAVVHFNNAAYSQKGLINLSPSVAGYDGYSQVYLEDSPQYLPVFDLKGTDGRALARALHDNPKTHLNFSFNPDLTATFMPGDQLSRVGSQGPNVDAALSIKPDLIAPGQSILSTVPAASGSSYADAYDRQSGTSMAAAHVSGLALLIKQAHPGYTPFDIRAALANTAHDIGQTANAQGAGRADVQKAIETPVLLTAVQPIRILDERYQPLNFDNPNPSASFGLVRPGSGPQLQTLRLTNKSAEPLAYSARIEWKAGGPSAGVTAELSQSDVRLSANGTAAFSLTLQASESAALNAQSEGVVIVASPGQPELRLPFIAYIGTQMPSYPWIGIRDLAVSDKLIYPKRETGNSTKLTFSLAPNYAFALLQVLVADKNNNAVGFLDLKMATTAPLGRGPYTYTFNGTCVSAKPDGTPIVDGSGKPVYISLPDGYYKFYVAAVAIGSDGSQTPFSWMTSFKIDNAPAPTSGTSSDPAPVPDSGAKAVIAPDQRAVSVVPTAAKTEAGTVLTLSEADFARAVQTAGSANAAILVSGKEAGGSVRLSLTADQSARLAALADGSTLVFRAGNAAFALPTGLLKKAPAAAGQLELTIGSSAANEAMTARITAEQGKGIGTPVSFEAVWRTPAGEVPLTVPSGVFIKRSFTVPGSVEPGKAGVLVEQNGAVTPVASVFAKQPDGTTLVTVSRPGFSVYAAASRQTAFTDLASSYAASEIQTLAAKWILDGTSATTFSPQGSLTRAEFTAMLVRALGLSASGAAAFRDVRSTDWFASEVAAATEAGLVQGVGGGRFAPNAKLTREELAVLLERALRLTGMKLPAGQASASAYKDEPALSAFAKDSVNALTASGVLEGYTLGSSRFYRPKNAASREFAARSLYRLLNGIGLIE